MSEPPGGGISQFLRKFLLLLGGAVLEGRSITATTNKNFLREKVHPQRKFWLRLCTESNVLLTSMVLEYH